MGNTSQVVRLISNPLLIAIANLILIANPGERIAARVPLSGQIKEDRLEFY